MSSFRTSGRVGPLTGVKEGGKRVDVKKLTTDFDTDFDFLIETKTPRFAWARAALCPCIGFNDQTDQVDPDCALCNGQGWHFFQPHDYTRDDELIGTLSDQQEAIITKANAVVIRALSVSAVSQPDMFAVLGRWAMGSTSITTRPGNRLGYYDRLIAIDDEMVFSEVIVPDGSGRTKLRYPAVALNLLRSLTTVYSDTHLYLDAGDIVWRSGMEPTGSRLSVHYICRPVWVVMEHMKLNRTSMTKAKSSTVATPAGDTLPLPQQVLARLEHLPMDP